MISHMTIIGLPKMGRIEKTEKGLSQTGCLVELVATKINKTITTTSHLGNLTMTNIWLQL